MQKTQSQKRIQSQSSDLLHDIMKAKVSYLMLAPYMLFFLFLIIIPIIMSIALSFTYFNMLELPKWTGIINYTRLLLDDDVFVIALRNTFLFAFITGPISYVLCFIFAWIINDLSPKTRAFVTLVFYAPSISGQVYVIWRFIFSPDSYGLANGFLMQWGFIKEPLLWLQDANMSLNLVIMVSLWLSLGTGFLAFIAGLQNVDKSLYESGAIDGIKNRWMELWYITLPSMAPMLLFGAVIQIGTSFAVSDVSIQLAGLPSVKYAAHTVAVHAYDYGFIRFEMGYACAISVVLFAIMLLTNKIVTKFLSKVGS
jgi:multiple sugar transport system permease protein